VSAAGIGSKASRRVNGRGRKIAVKPTFWRCLAFWFVFSTIVSSAAADAASEPTNNSSRDIVVSGTLAPPTLMFACDGSTKEIESMFSKPGVIADLQALKAGVVLALPDLSADRARLARQLNQADIPITAWLTLPSEEGYYLNAGNAPQAGTRFADFEKWSAAFGLRWAAIGLDIEPNLQDFTALKQGSKWQVIATLIGRSFEGERIRRAQNAYSELIGKMRAHGYRVQTYQFPFISDERRVRSTLLERIGGIVDVKGDEEVLMLYTTFHHETDSALIWVYGPDAQAIAVGSTSGSDSDSRFVPLDWIEFSRDLRVAGHFSHTVGVYNLEGCIRQGFLSRLTSMNWNQPVTIPVASVRTVEHFRMRIQTVLWLASHLFYFVTAFVVVAGWIIVRWKVRRNARERVG
jgi:hypothetical protein